MTKGCAYMPWCWYPLRRGHYLGEEVFSNWGQFPERADSWGQSAGSTSSSWGNKTFRSEGAGTTCQTAMQWIPHLPCAQVSPWLFSVCIRQERLGCTGITNDLQIAVTYNHRASLKLSFDLRPRLLGNRLYQKYCWLLHLKKSMANHALTLKAQKWQTSLLVTFHWLNHVTWLSLMS